MMTDFQIDLSDALAAARGYGQQPLDSLDKNEYRLATLGRVLAELRKTLEEDLDDYDLASEVRHILAYGPNDAD